METDTCRGCGGVDAEVARAANGFNGFNIECECECECDAEETRVCFKDIQFGKLLLLLQPLLMIIWLNCGKGSSHVTFGCVDDSFIFTMGNDCALN